MAILVSDVKAAVQAKGYGTDTTTQQTTFLREALRRLYAMRRWRFLLAYDSSLTLPLGGSTLAVSGLTGFNGKVEAVRLTSAAGTTYELKQRSPEAVQRLDALDNTNDVPLYWTLRDNATLQFWPRADVQYTANIDYIKQPALPINDTDAITWPDDHMDVLTWAVVKAMAFRQRDWFTTPTADQEYQTALDEMEQAYGIYSAQSPAEVGHWDGWRTVAR